VAGSSPSTLTTSLVSQISVKLFGFYFFDSFALPKFSHKALQFQGEPKGTIMMSWIMGAGPCFLSFFLIYFFSGSLLLCVRSSMNSTQPRWLTAADKACLEMLSESDDQRQPRMEWARLASDDAYDPATLCLSCGTNLGTGRMIKHLHKFGNAECLHYAENSGDERWLKAFELVTAEASTRPSPSCHTRFPRSNFSFMHQQHIKATKNVACMNFQVARKSTDPSVLKCYNNVSQ